jgi:hypothetical protein
MGHPHGAKQAPVLPEDIPCRRAEAQVLHVEPAARGLHRFGRLYTPDPERRPGPHHQAGVGRVVVGEAPPPDAMISSSAGPISCTTPSPWMIRTARPGPPPSPDSGPIASPPPTAPRPPCRPPAPRPPSPTFASLRFLPGTGSTGTRLCRPTSIRARTRRASALDPQSPKGSPATARSCETRPRCVNSPRLEPSTAYVRSRRPVRRQLPAPGAGNCSGSRKKRHVLQLPPRRPRGTTRAEPGPRPLPGISPNPGATPFTPFVRL